MDDYRPGQLVRKRTGGPVMIVKVVVRRDGRSVVEGYRCEWLDKGRLEEGMFAADELMAHAGADPPTDAGTPTSA